MALPDVMGYDDPFIRQFLEAGVFDISTLSILTRLTWLWPFSWLHTAILNLMLPSLVVWIRRKFLYFYHPYAYEPLASGRIRILTLHAGNVCGTVRFTLSDILLKDANINDRSFEPYDNEYYALSYTWGPSTPTAPVVCNGQILEVGHNLHEALLYLRHRGMQKIWIDAICIDQSNLKERAGQVQIMKQIYQNAIGVVVWLGPGSTETDDAFRFLDIVNQKTSSELWFRNPAVNEKLWDASRHRDLRALEKLLNRPWFRRAWVIQEVIAAESRSSGRVWVHCGKQARFWHAFLRSILSLSNGRVLELVAKTTEISSALDQIHLFAHILDGDIELVSLATMARFAEATNPRDKVFALVGLAKDNKTLQVVQGGQLQDFPIDYGISLRQVYINAAQAMILSSGLESVLTEACHNIDAIQALPSWVPDWSIRPEIFPINYNPLKSAVSRMEPAYGSRDIVKPFETRDISRTISTVPHFLEDGLLRLSGANIDSIKIVSEPYPKFKEEGDVYKINDWLEQCDKIYDESSREQGRLPAQNDQWTVLIADRVGNQKPAPKKFRRCYSICRRLCMCTTDLNRWSDPVEEIDEFIRNGMSYIQEMRRRCTGRRYVLTTKKYVGLVPHTAKVGDMILIVDGCEVPFVLRRRGKRFQLVGDCYVHGLIRGEAAGPTWKTRNGQKGHRYTDITLE